MADRLTEILSSYHPGIEVMERWAFLHQKPFKEKRVPRGAYVPYRENRAFIFPASTFHSIGPSDFDAAASDRMRCSVSVFLDDRSHWEAQRQLEQSTRESVTHEF